VSAVTNPYDCFLIALFKFFFHKSCGQIKNQIAADFVQRIIKAAKDGEKFKVVITPYSQFRNPENYGLGYCCFP